MQDSQNQSKLRETILVMDKTEKEKLCRIMNNTPFVMGILMSCHPIYPRKIEVGKTEILVFSFEDIKTICEALEISCSIRSIPLVFIDQSAE